MKKSLILVSILPILLASCGKNNYVSFEEIKEYIDTISDTHEHPYYRVQGYLDFNNSTLEVDWKFRNNPEGDTFVPFARYNEGFYCPAAMNDSAVDPEDVAIYGMASRSYWLRAPMRVTKDNFYRMQRERDDDDNLVDTEDENPTCARYQFESIINFWVHDNSGGSAAPSSNIMYFELLPNGGFAVGGKKVHTYITIDNYPVYPDPYNNPEVYIIRDPDTGEIIADSWSPNRPLPVYKNQVDAKMDIRFEYDKDGWLVREFAQSIGYDVHKEIAGQFSLESVYTYQFE